MDTCQQGAVTLKTPFEIRSNGIFFRDCGWGLELFGVTNPDLHTMVAIKNCLDKAYQVGFSEGVHVGVGLGRDREIKY